MKESPEKLYRFRIDGDDECCVGFAFNRTTRKCESKGFECRHLVYH